MAKGQDCGRDKKRLYPVIWLLEKIIQGKMNWDEAMDRATGKYYEKQIREAAARFREKNPATLTVDKGFKQWLEVAGRQLNSYDKIEARG